MISWMKGLTVEGRGGGLLNYISVIISYTLSASKGSLLVDNLYSITPNAHMSTFGVKNYSTIISGGVYAGLIEYFTVSVDILFLSI